nr:hypothetical protein [uncultured Prevotella sp.]
MIVLMVLFFASCSEQHLQEDRLASSKVGEQKGVVKAPRDSVLLLLHQARWGDGSAYLKLADCYRDGFGVKKDFFGMITMANMAESRGGINRIDDYIYSLPDGNEYKTLFLLMDRYKSYLQEDADSVEQVLFNNDSPEAKTLLGLITVDKGDTLSGMNMIKEAAEQGCSLAEMLLTVPDWKGRLRADATKLSMIADRIPLAYSMLGDLYYEPDEDGHTDKKFAVECYMKAEEHAVLGPHGAERVLDYYKNGGNAQLTEDDVKRLELIVQPKSVETE